MGTQGEAVTARPSGTPFSSCRNGQLGVPSPQSTVLMLLSPPASLWIRPQPVRSLPACLLPRPHPSVRLSAVYTEPGSCAHRAETGTFSGRGKRIHGSVFRRGRMVEVLSRHDAWLHCPVRHLRKRGECATTEAARRKTQLAARNANAVGSCRVQVIPGRRFRWGKQSIQTDKIRVHMV